MKNFNPQLLTLIKSLEFIKRNEPCPMSKIPITISSGYLWLWGMRDKMGLLKVERSKKDGRSHIVILTKKGEKILKILKELHETNIIYCKLCKKQIKKFYKVPNKKWKQITGKLKNEVICKPCFNNLKRK